MTRRDADRRRSRCSGIRRGEPPELATPAVDAPQLLMPALPVIRGWFTLITIDDYAATTTLKESRVPTLHPLTEKLSVSAQVELADIPALAAQGFRSLINNRPDGEADDQPPSATLAAAAQRAGLTYRHVPVVSGQLQEAQIDAFAAALAQIPAPVLAFCRTGTRSTTLWALQADGSSDVILETARAAGYDLTALRPRLTQGRRG